MWLLLFFSLNSLAFAQSLPEVRDPEVVNKIFKKFGVKSLSVDPATKIVKIDPAVYKNFGSKYDTHFRNESLNPEKPLIGPNPQLENFPLRNKHHEVHFLSPVKGSNAFNTIYIVSGKRRILITEGYDTKMEVCDEEMNCFDADPIACDEYRDATPPVYKRLQRNMRGAFLNVRMAQGLLENENKLSTPVPVQKKISQELDALKEETIDSIKMARLLKTAVEFCDEFGLSFDDPKSTTPDSRSGRSQ
jgi:hypothetical protein